MCSLHDLSAPVSGLLGYLELVPACLGLEGPWRQPACLCPSSEGWQAARLVCLTGCWLGCWWLQFKMQKSPKDVFCFRKPVEEMSPEAS